MTDEHKFEKDGIRSDGVPWYEGSPLQLQSFVTASADLSRFQAPVFVHANNPHERLYVALFDGTGNDYYKDPEHATNVAKIYLQIAGRENEQIRAGYVPGPGTEDGYFARTIDGMDGHTYDTRVEEMYRKFIKQAWEWQQEDPHVQIRVVGVGFSRGAEELAGFARVVQERGVQDSAGAHYTMDAQGLVSGVEYTAPPLVPPGRVAQAVGLFDPVGTGEPVKREDRRLPPSVISGFEIIAADERRRLFKSDHIIDPGMTADGRFLAVTVAGAHSDVGDGYHRNGLAIRSGNLMIDYINGFSDRPILQRQVEPTDPRMNVVHRSEHGMLLYELDYKVDRNSSNGYNERLVPKREALNVADPYNAEPRDELLNSQFERQLVNPGEPVAQSGRAESMSLGALSAQLDRMITAGQADDWSTFSRENAVFANGDAGLALMAGAGARVDWLELQAAQQQAIQPPPLHPVLQSPGMAH